MPGLNIIQKLIEIRNEMGYFKKETDGQYTAYVGIEKLMERITGLMNKHNVLLITNVIDSSLTKIDKNFVSSQKWKMTWVNGDDPKDREDVLWFADGSNMQSASFAGGGGLTYYTRYFLLMQFNCVTGKDDPEIKSNKDLNTQKKTGSASDKKRWKMMDELLEMLDSKGLNKKVVVEHFPDLNKFTDITIDQINESIEIVNNLN